MNIYNYYSESGLYLGSSVADESPLEPGTFLIPANSTTEAPPEDLIGKNRVFVSGSWTYADIPAEANPEPVQEVEMTYAQKRATEYPPITDYIDGVVKGDQAQVQAYIDACLAVKAKYPKPTDQ